jgi:hypothetical protein
MQIARIPSRSESTEDCTQSNRVRVHRCARSKGKMVRKTQSMLNDSLGFLHARAVAVLDLDGAMPNLKFLAHFLAHYPSQEIRGSAPNK